MKRNVFVIYGSKTAEYEVSLLSAMNVINELNRDKYNVYGVYISQKGVWSYPKLITEKIIETTQLIDNNDLSVTKSISNFLSCSFNEEDIVFPVLHGPMGEDGTIQGLLEMAGIAYVGNNVLGSSTGMDKIVMKKIFAHENIPQTPSIFFESYQLENDMNEAITNVKNTLGFPVYVKPANLGSSIGITRAENESELINSLKIAMDFDRRVLVEKEVVGREIIIGLLGNEIVETSFAGEWQRSTEFFDFDDKYLDDNLTPIIPANVNDDIYNQLCILAKKAYKALDGFGLMRADFFVDNNNQVYLNEINTLPGFTSHSMYLLLIEKTFGLKYTEFLDRLIDLSTKRYNEQNKRRYWR